MPFPSGFKPLLAGKADLATLAFPAIASPKIDGWRCHTMDSQLYSRTLKLIPNLYTQRKFAGLVDCLDGELVTYTDGKIDPLNVVQGKLSRVDGEPDVQLHVFDCFTRPEEPYSARLLRVDVHLGADKRLTRVPTWDIDSAEALAELELHLVDELGWEGVMTRRPEGLYKFGRSTTNEGTLLKVKRSEDDEGRVAGYAERQHNGNEATRDVFGRTKRSSAAAGKVGLDTLGALSVEWRGVTFDLGTGMDDETRAALWARRDANLIGQSVTFNFKGVGPNGRPLLPVFKALRTDL